MTECIFCRLAAGGIPSKIVYEDESVVAFEDVNPQAPVHVLIIPRKHIPTTLDLDEEGYRTIGKLFWTANRVAAERGISQRGFRLVMNTKSDGGQTVYHVHLHLLGGRQMHWPPG